MSIQDYSDLNEVHKDALLELGNIGTGSALTSLSQLVDKPIKMDLPCIRILALDELFESVEFQSNPNVGVVIEVHGDLECVVTFMLSASFSRVMAEELTGEPLDDVRCMNEMQRSVICEIGNIMCNSYLNALASLLQADLAVSVPTLDVGSCEEVLGSFSREFPDENAELLFIQNTFHYMDRDYLSYILLSPRFSSLRRIFDALFV